MKAKQIVAALTGNAFFTTPTPTLAVITAAADALGTAINKAQDKSRSSLSAVRDKKRELTDLLRTLGEYVNTTAAGDETKLLTSGFDLYKTPEKHRDPEPVSKLEAIYTNQEGRINLVWERSKKARYYNVWMSADGGKQWTMINTTLSRKLMVEALSSGTRYQFKVVAVNVSGSAPASDIATQVAA